MRTTMLLGLLVLLLTEILVISATEVILAQGQPDRPTQIHISQGNADGSAMTISWMTNAALGSTIKLGRQSRVYDNTYQVLCTLLGGWVWVMHHPEVQVGCHYKGRAGSGRVEASG